MKKLKKQKRRQICVYVTDEELQCIKQLAKRVSPEKKSKPAAQIIRRGILALASNPDTDYVFDPGVCLKIPASEILLREKLYLCMRENIDILKKHGIKIPSENDVESDSKEIEKD